MMPAPPGPPAPPDHLQQFADAAGIPWVIVALAVVGGAVVGWAVTEALKKTALQRVKYTDHVNAAEAKRRLWWTPMLVCVSVVLGAAVGAFVGALDWSWQYGLVCGACGGGLSSAIVAVLKRKIKEV